jgi:hypothetical protein
MSEETQDHNDGTWSGLKKTIIGLITTAVLGAGGVFTNKLIGGDDEKESTPVQQVAPVININNTQTQQQSTGGGKTIIIKEKSNTPVQAAPTPKPKKKEGDEFTEEAPKW